MPRDTITITPHDIPPDPSLTLRGNWVKLIASYKTAKRTLVESAAEYSTRDVSRFLNELDTLTNELIEMLANEEHSLEKLQSYQKMLAEMNNIISQTIGGPEVSDIVKAVAGGLVSRAVRVPYIVGRSARKVLRGK